MKRSKSKIAIGVIDTLLILCFAIIFFIHFVTPIRFELWGIPFRAAGFTRPLLLMALLWGLRYLILILSKPKIGNERMTWYYLGIGIIAGASLLLEVAMTRVFAVAFFNHYAFLIISTALFGFGFSGVFLAIFPGIKRFNFDKLLTVLAICFSLSTIITLKIVVDVPLQFGNLKDQAVQMLYLSLYFLALAVPFFFSGMVVALLLSRIAGKVNKLYFSDLLGAGIGCFPRAAAHPGPGRSGGRYFRRHARYCRRCLLWETCREIDDCHLCRFFLLLSPCCFLYVTTISGSTFMKRNGVLTCRKMPVK